MCHHDPARLRANTHADPTTPEGTTGSTANQSVGDRAIRNCQCEHSSHAGCAGSDEIHGHLTLYGRYAVCGDCCRFGHMPGEATTVISDECRIIVDVRVIPLKAGDLATRSRIVITRYADLSNQKEYTAIVWDILDTLRAFLHARIDNDIGVDARLIPVKGGGGVATRFRLIVWDALETLQAFLHAGLSKET
jgi:hypothetical protein